MITARCSDFMIHEALNRTYPTYDVSKGQDFTVINHGLCAEDGISDGRVSMPLLDLAEVEKEGVDNLAARCIMGEAGAKRERAPFLESLDMDLITQSMEDLDLELGAILCSPGTFLKKIYGAAPTDVHFGLSQEIQYDVLIAVPPPEFLGLVTRIHNLRGRPVVAGLLRFSSTCWFRADRLPVLSARCDPRSFMAMLEVLQ